MTFQQKNLKIPLNIPHYSYKYPCSTRVKLSAVKGGIFHPTLPTFRNVDRDTHMNKLSDEHCQTSTQYVVSKNNKEPPKIGILKEEVPHQKFYVSNKEIQNASMNWSAFLDTCPERFDIRLPELVENKGDFHFCGYGVRHLRHGNKTTRFTLKEGNGFDLFGRRPTPSTEQTLYRNVSLDGKSPKLPWKNP